MLLRADPGLFDGEVRPRLLAPSAELLLEALPPLSPQTRFLEVQAGGGLLSRCLVERIAGLGRLVSIDEDPDRARVLPVMARRAGRALASPFALPFRDGGFDIVLDGSLGLDAASAGRLAELRRVTRPGGFLLVAAVMHDSFQRLFDVVLDLAEGRRLEAVQQAVHARRKASPTLDEMRALMQGAGATVAHVGVEERLIGLYDGEALQEDALVRDVILGDVAAVAPAGFIDAVAGAVDGWCPEGLPVVVTMAVISARIR